MAQPIERSIGTEGGAGGGAGCHERGKVYHNKREFLFFFCCLLFVYNIMLFDWRFGPCFQCCTRTVLYWYPSELAQDNNPSQLSTQPQPNLSRQFIGGRHTATSDTANFHSLDYR